MDTTQLDTPEPESYLQARVRELEAELKRRDAREQIQQWSLRGQLPPALAPLAEAILMQGDAPVQFSGETTSVAELFRRFVDSLPPQNLLTELAPTPESEPPAFSADAPVPAAGVPRPEPRRDSAHYEGGALRCPH